MNALLLAAGLTSCSAFSGWVGYIYEGRMRANVEAPKAWVIERNQKFEPIIDLAYEYPRGQSTEYVEADALEHCETYSSAQ